MNMEEIPLRCPAITRAERLRLARAAGVDASHIYNSVGKLNLSIIMSDKHHSDTVLMGEIIDELANG